MKTVGVIALCASLATACSDGPAPVTEKPATTATPAPADARTEIPRISGVPVAQGVIPESGKGDVDDISRRSYLRVLVTPEQTHFETVDGQHRGRTVDAVDAFTAFLNNSFGQPVSVAFIPTPEDKLVAELLAGKGDIAVNLRVTFERDDQVSFGSPVYSGIREWIVTGPASATLVSLEDVGGRTIHVRSGSDHHASMIRLNDQLKQINRLPARITVVNAGQTDQDLMNLVSRGTIPAALVDDYVLEACCGDLTGLKVNRDVAVSQDGVIAWATRKDAPRLLAKINEFFAKHRLTF
jgi:membrane-bound lytic murein transglycosylase MltF